MIQLSAITKSFGDRVLFDHVTWQITARERVGLCGPNGAGKTTLLKMMAGLDEPDGGAVLKPSSLTVGYLPQDGLSHTGRTVFDEASLAFGELLAMKAEMHAVEANMMFVHWPAGGHDRLRAAGAAYYPMPAPEGAEAARLVTSWSTTPADVDAFVAALAG